jgi:hypothetical protein
MLKLILPLLLTLSLPAFSADQCASLFHSDYTSIKPLIDDLIAPREIKKQLLQQARHHQTILDFVVDFLVYVDKLHHDRILEIFAGIDLTHHRSLGFRSPTEARKLKSLVFAKQIRILALAPASDITPEFRADLKRIAEKLYSPHTNKRELARLLDRLDTVIKSYTHEY